MRGHMREFRFRELSIPPITEKCHAFSSDVAELRRNHPGGSGVDETFLDKDGRRSSVRFVICPAAKNAKSRSTGILRSGGDPLFVFLSCRCYAARVAAWYYKYWFMRLPEAEADVRELTLVSRS